MVQCLYLLSEESSMQPLIWCAPKPVELAGCVLHYCFILQPPPLPPSSVPTPHFCVCLMPFPLRHGTGQPLRSGEVFRSQTPCEKALFPPVQKQISGLPCWDQVYVSVSPPASMCGMTTMWQEKIEPFNRYCNTKLFLNDETSFTPSSKKFHRMKWIKSKRELCNSFKVNFCTAHGWVIPYIPNACLFRYFITGWS